VHTKAGDLNF